MFLSEVVANNLIAPGDFVRNAVGELYRVTSVANGTVQGIRYVGNGEFAGGGKFSTKSVTKVEQPRDMLSTLDEAVADVISPTGSTVTYTQVETIDAHVGPDRNNVYVGQRDGWYHVLITNSNNDKIVASVHMIRNLDAAHQTASTLSDRLVNSQPLGRVSRPTNTSFLLRK